MIHFPEIQKYRITGNFREVKCLIFGNWWVLIWQICGHVPLNMHIMVQNGFGEWLSKC